MRRRAAEPLVAGLGLKTTQGRLVVDEFLSVPGYPEVYSCGDVAAVPDLTEPGQITAMTAQHAQRQEYEPPATLPRRTGTASDGRTVITTSASW